MRTLGFTIFLASVSGPAQAQTGEAPSRASASITIERSLTVASLRPMSFSPVSSHADIAAVAQSGEAIIRVTGDPGRLYRISVPRSVVAQPGDLTVDTLAIVSDNSGDITRTLTARMDGDGVDRLRISGMLRGSNDIRLSNVTAAVPVGVDYE